MKFPIKDFFSKSDQIRKFTKEILNKKLHFLCSVKPLTATSLSRKCLNSWSPNNWKMHLQVKKD